MPKLSLSLLITHTLVSHILVRVIATGLLVSSLSGLSTSYAQAAEAEFCMQYARDLISMPHKKSDAPKTCQSNQPHWSTDKAAHIKWCLSASKAEANKKRYSHNKLVNLCNDTYKLVMLDRKRVATLPLSGDEEMEMKPAPDKLIKALTSGNIENPYAALYPAVNQATLDGKLAKCNYFSLAVNMDSNPDTKEWLVTVDEQCLTDAEQQTGQQPVWLIQQIAETYRVLFEGQHHTITLRYSEESEETGENTKYRNISITTPLTKQEETSKRCGSIIADWHYKEGRYLPYRGRADEHGACLPEYELPDYLQGENTFDLAEGEWKKGMEEEEEKRLTLYAPYQKALEEYIPEWISNIERLVPPNNSSSTANKASEGKPQTLKDKPGDETSKDKGFMQSVRSLLGID